MKYSITSMNTSLSICLATFLLVSCGGSSDLDNRFRGKIEAAKASDAALAENSEGGETTDTSEGEDNTEQTNEPIRDVVVSADGQVVTIDGADYDLIFGDEFTGTAIDATKWNTSYQWGADFVINEEEQYYVSTLDDPDFGYDPFYFDGDALVITAVETPAELSEKANGQSYLSGSITSAAKFTTTYGYVEMRAKMPEGFGLWSGFWMLGADFVDLKPQLFVAEHDGGKPDSVFHNYNYHDADGNLRSPGQWEVSAAGVTTDFHTYGVQWEEQLLVFYIDGLPKYRIEGENVSSQAMYLIANLAVGGTWPGSPQSTTTFPAELSIDYIRAYSKR